MGGRSLRLFPVALMLLLLTSATAAAELDKSAVEFTPPSEIKWVRNAAGINEQAELFGTRAARPVDVVRLT